VREKEVQCLHTLPPVALLGRPPGIHLNLKELQPNSQTAAARGRAARALMRRRGWRPLHTLSCCSCSCCHNIWCIINLTVTSAHGSNTQPGRRVRQHTRGPPLPTRCAPASRRRRLSPPASRRRHLLQIPAPSQIQTAQNKFFQTRRAHRPRTHTQENNHDITDQPGPRQTLTIIYCDSRAPRGLKNKQVRRLRRHQLPVAARLLLRTTIWRATASLGEQTPQTYGYCI
jgi:hypothetical protein